MSHITPKINESDYVERQVELNEKMLKEIEKQIENAPKGSLVTMNSMDPLSQVTTTTQQQQRGPRTATANTRSRRGSGTR